MIQWWRCPTFCRYVRSHCLPSDHVLQVDIPPEEVESTTLLFFPIWTSPEQLALVLVLDSGLIANRPAKARWAQWWVAPRILALSLTGLFRTSLCHDNRREIRHQYRWRPIGFLFPRRRGWASGLRRGRCLAGRCCTRVPCSVCCSTSLLECPTTTAFAQCFGTRLLNRLRLDRHQVRSPRTSRREGLRCATGTRKSCGAPSAWGRFEQQLARGLLLCHHSPNFHHNGFDLG